MKTKDMLIKYLSIDDEAKEILNVAGYNTLGDLAATKKEDVEKIFNIPMNSAYDYNGIRSFKHLKALLHYNYEITFLGEYDDIGLTPEVANTPVSELELPVAVKNILTKQLYAYTLGDLLTLDYKSIVQARNFGETYLGILKKCIHDLGYTLKDEKPTLKETVKALKEQGVTLLEETISDPRIYTPLYKNGIYTLTDLLNFGPDVCKLSGFGPLKQKELIEKMNELNLTFDSPLIEQKPQETAVIPKPVTETEPTEAIISQAEAENNTIRTRIEKKQALLEKYNCLMEEREQLIQQEKELDKLIEAKVNEMKEGFSSNGKQCKVLTSLK